MKSVDIREAQKHLAKLVGAALHGEPFVIARAGKPLVKVVQIQDEAPRRTGFLKGQIDVPEDFDEMGAEEIRALFEGPAEAPKAGIA